MSDVTPFSLKKNSISDVDHLHQLQDEARCVLVGNGILPISPLCKQTLYLMVRLLRSALFVVGYQMLWTKGSSCFS